MHPQHRVVLFDVAGSTVSELDARLRAEEFQVYTVDSEEALLDALVYAHPDTAVLVESPSRPPSLQLVRRCQERGRSLVVVVRPGSTVAQTITLLAHGADYVCYVDSPALVAAQLRAGLRRFGRDFSVPAVIKLGYLEIDLQGRRTTVNGHEVALTRTEFEVLRVLAERPGTVLPSGEIMQHVAGVRMPENEAQDLLKVHISRLRQKLERDSNNPQFIRTVRGQGYMYAFERRSRERSEGEPPG